MQCIVRTLISTDENIVQQILEIYDFLLIENLHKSVLLNRLIFLVSRVFANGPADRGSIPGRVIPKTFKIVPDTSLLKTHQYGTYQG